MSTLILAVLIVIVIAALVVLKEKFFAKDAALSFESRNHLFSPAERSFLGVLGQALDSQYHVFGKVRLGDIVKPAKELSRSNRTTAGNKINQKHVDFVVCSAADLAVIGVVELDDQSHEREDRGRRDSFVDQVLAGAKIPIIRFSAKKAYAIREVRAKLTEAFTIPTAQPAPAAAVVPPSAELSDSVAVEHPIAAEEVAPVCPKCAANMVKRQARNGPHAGEWFWACSTYPKCRQVVAIGEKKK